MKLNSKTKADIRFFIYYLVNGTLDFDLLNNQLQTDHLTHFAKHPSLFFESCCIFINHKQANPVANMNTRVAEYICKHIEPENFKYIERFKTWEANFEISGYDFINCFKDFSYKFALDKIDRLRNKGILFKDYIFDGATFWETVYIIWANNLELKNEIVLNHEYAINRAINWFIDKEHIEAWELELEV